MAVSQTDIDTLNAAIASGTRSVTLGGQTITYGTVDALIAARNDLQRQLTHDQAKTDGRVRSRITIMQYLGRGFN